MQFHSKHLRVDTCGQKEETGDEKKDIISRGGRNTQVNAWEDFRTTLFIGNLPFVVSEEDLRIVFADCGKITNIRLVRDPKTHLGKGIGYIMFSTKEEMQKALDTKKNLKFKHRELRVNRAVEPKRREKKAKRKEAALMDRREKRAKRLEGAELDDEALALKRNLGEVQSDDSEDEAPKKKKKVAETIRLEETNFGKKSNRPGGASTGEIELSNLHRQTKQKKKALLSSMIKNGSSLKAESMEQMSIDEKHLYKGKHDTFKKGLIEKIARHKKDNLKKINKIRIKTKKI